MQLNRHAVALLVAGLLVVAGGAFAINRSLSASDLSVDEAYFVERARDPGGNLTVEAVLYMSNRGGGSTEDIRVTAFVVPQRTGLATDTVTTRVNAIRSATTAEVHLTIRVPPLNLSAPETYGVMFLVFEGGLLTLKGVGSLGYTQCCFYANGYGSDGLKGVGAEAGYDLRTSAPSFSRVG